MLLECCFSICILLRKSVKGHIWQEINHPGNHTGFCPGRCSSKTTSWPAHPAFPSPTRAKNTILLVHIATPAQILHPPSRSLPLLLLLVIGGPCSLPWSGPLALVQNGLIHEDICMLSPVPAYLCNSNYSF